MKDAYRDAVWFIDFASLDDPELVPNVVARKPWAYSSRLGNRSSRNCAARQGATAVADLRQLRARAGRICALGRAMLRWRPGADDHRMTSRAAAWISGEQIYRLPTLSLPDAATRGDQSSIRRGACLFVDRAQHPTLNSRCEPSAGPAVGQLCIRLDGIPFALELAAALIARALDRRDQYAPGRPVQSSAGRQSHGFAATANALRDARLAMDCCRRPSCRVLRRCSLFLCAFCLVPAPAVATDETIGESVVADLLAQLVARSLVVAETNGADTRYRMLETTRAYGREKLGAAGETEAMQRRHAEYFRDRFESAVDAWLRLPEATWRAPF